MRISRKDFLFSLGGATVGMPLGALSQRSLSPELAPADGASLASAAAVGVRSYSQCGEDLVVSFIFNYLHIKDVTYLDIGAYDPIEINNTYLFYRLGHRGVLVEPNVAMCEKLRAVRPEDTTLAAGIGVTGVREAEYYVMSEPAWNTFSKEEAEHMVRSTNGRVRIRDVIKMPLLDINDVLVEHFDGAPAFVSIDAEGWHLAILKAIDYRRFRPKVICVETLVSGTNRAIPETPAFMETQGYVARGGSFVNTIFVDSKIV